MNEYFHDCYTCTTTVGNEHGKSPGVYVKSLCKCGNGNVVTKTMIFGDVFYAFHGDSFLNFNKYMIF